MDIVKGITDGGLGAVNVVDENRKLIGIITDGDLRRAIQQRDAASLSELKCESIMTRNPVVAEADLLAYDALRLMEDRPSQISVLPVVNGDSVCVGLIRLHDIVRSGL
jgi:arabinose-5-phosphate isomerase